MWRSAERSRIQADEHDVPGTSPGTCSSTPLGVFVSQIFAQISGHVFCPQNYTQNYPQHFCQKIASNYFQVYVIFSVVSRTVIHGFKKSNEHPRGHFWGEAQESLFVLRRNPNTYHYMPNAADTLERCEHPYLFGHKTGLRSSVCGFNHCIMQHFA